MLAAVHGLLMARVETLFFAEPTEIAFPGKSMEPQGRYVRVTDLRNVPDRWALDGSMPMDRPGILQLDLFLPFGRYQVSYDHEAQTILDHFPADLRLEGEGALVTVQKSYALPGRSDGNHWHTPVRVDYRASA